MTTKNEPNKGIKKPIPETKYVFPGAKNPPPPPKPKPPKGTDK